MSGTRNTRSSILIDVSLDGRVGEVFPRGNGDERPEDEVMGSYTRFSPREVTRYSDGSLRIGCTTVTAKAMEKILQIYKEQETT